jgi:hypothetical protein
MSELSPLSDARAVSGASARTSRGRRLRLGPPRCELLEPRSFAVVGAGHWSATTCRSRSRPTALLYLCAVRLPASGSARAPVRPELSRQRQRSFRVRCHLSSPPSGVAERPGLRMASDTRSQAASAAARAPVHLLLRCWPGATDHGHLFRSWARILAFWNSRRLCIRIHETAR